MSEHIKAIEQLVKQFPPGNLNRKLWAFVIAELKELRGLKQAGKSHNELMESDDDN